MLSVDEHIGVEAVHAELNTPDDFRMMFLGAIEKQRAIIAQAESMIAHYEYALSEMAKEAAA